MLIENHKGSNLGRPDDKAERFASTSLGPKSVEKTKDAAQSVGAGLESLGESIRDHKPLAGVFSDAGEAVANKLEAGGRYLEGHGFEGISEDVTDMIRRNPVPALLIGLGVGFLIARMLRR